MNSDFKIKNKKKDFAVTLKQRFHEPKPIREKIKVSKIDYIKGEAREILLHGAKINYINAQIDEPIEIEVKHSFPFLKIHFEISGTSEYRSLIDPSETVIIPDGCYNFFYLPKVLGTLTYPAPQRKSLEITLTEQFLINIFKEHWEVVGSDYARALQDGTTYKLYELGQTIPPALLVIINDIIHCTYQKEIKEIYLISKITEILSYLFSEIKNKRDKTLSVTSLKKSEYQTIQYAGQILNENIKNPPTIKELSLLTGINQCKLKTNFKKVYHQPIFQYVTQIRMEKAQKLIIENDDMTIAEVAYEVGYKNPQHFTVAFKKKYHYLPSDLRKKMH